MVSNLSEVALLRSLAHLKFSIQEESMKPFLVFVAMSLAVLAAGCATVPSAPPLTIEQLVERASKGEPAASLLASLRASHVEFRLNGSDFAKLKASGLPEPVLDELMKREIDSARADERRRTALWGPPYGHGYGYGYYWPRAGWYRRPL